MYLRKCQTDRKVADSTFSAMKPKMICTVQETSLCGCKCEYCQNLGLLRETLIGLDFKGIPKNHAASIEITWCNFQRKADCESDEEEQILYHDGEMPRKECVQRKCKKCGVAKFQSKIMHDNMELIRKLKNVKWKQWHKVTYTALKGKKINKKMNYVQQSMTHGHKKLKRPVYEHSVKATFYHPEILECNETTPKLRQLHGCRDWMHAVCNTGVPGVVEWQDFDCCCVGCLTHTGDCSNKHLVDSWQRHSLTTHMKKELRELDFSHWMPSFVKIK